MAATRALPGWLAPSKLPVRTVAAMPTPRGTMNVKLPMVRSSVCPASAAVEMRPAKMMWISKLHLHGWRVSVGTRSRSR